MADIRTAKDSADLGAERERLASGVSVIERPDSKVVSRPEKPALPAIPDGEGKIPDEPGWTAGTPLFESEEHKRRIREFCSRHSGFHDINQMVAIVEACIRDKNQVSPARHDRLGLVVAFMRGPKKEMTETGGSVDDESTSVRSPMRESIPHCDEESIVAASTVEMHAPDDAAHDVRIAVLLNPVDNSSSLQACRPTASNQPTSLEVLRDAGRVILARGIVGFT